jgi:hypothetical protein
MTIDQAVERQRAEDVERGFSGEPERVDGKLQVKENHEA